MVDPLTRLRDLYLELNRLDPQRFHPRRCAQALRAARALTPAALRDEVAHMQWRLDRLRSSSGSPRR